MTVAQDRKSKYSLEINQDWCKLCKVCVEFCPVKNLKIQDSKLVGLDKCTGCMLCEKYCPDFAIIVKKQ